MAGDRNGTPSHSLPRVGCGVEGPQIDTLGPGSLGEFLI